jgi:dipeptidyl-peptidase-4
VFDPRVAPDGSAVALHRDGGMEVWELPEGGGGAAVAGRTLREDGVEWGRAEFVAAEEMGRSHGLWWSGDATRLAVARVDEREVARWHLADPTEPASAVRTVAYPAAGTSNARVGLAVLSAHGEDRVDVVLDGEDEYLAVVRWGEGPLTVLLQQRDQRRARIATVDPATGRTTTVRELADRAWVDLVAGSPAWSRGRLVTVEPAGEGDGARNRLHVDGRAVSPPELEVRALVAVRDDEAVVEVSDEDPCTVRVVAVPLDDIGGDGVVGEAARAVRRLGRLSPGGRGVERVVVGPDGSTGARIELSTDLDLERPAVRVVRGDVTHPLEVVSEVPVVTPRPRLVELGARRLRAALLLPSDVADDARLPVLLDPYGGPHAQRVLATRSAYLTSQWFADQGFAVLVVDGRGTPGRGPVWERSVAGDLAGPVLEDQLQALEAAVALEPRLDRTRVAIRGWSFGGYLAALAVLRRPDVVRAAIAGAPVTDWHLYDTHYTERYLGDPRVDPAAYERSNLVDADGRLVGAADWGDDPPGLMLVHGLVDDNVVAAHALRLSRALLADGRPHRFVPLPGVSHVAGADDLAARLLALELGFLRERLGAG